MSAVATRILLVDDHQILREGLRALLESEADLVVVAEAGTGQAAVALAAECHPDLIVIDLGLPDMSGFEAIRCIRLADSAVRIVVLSMHTEREFVLQAVAMGCEAYVPKSTAHLSLLQAIRAVQAGERFLHPQLTSMLMESLTHTHTEAEQFQALSEREQAVLRLTAQGYIGREIGEQLILSPKTIETYRQRAFEKLGLEHRSDLIRFALRAGILDEFKAP
ncbi:MAG: response regulator transcription factor [Anaerolineales bacterium]